ncbi:oligoribonuclease [Sporosarcina sp. FSL W7-1283]|uniref:oligoribonuclease n=1 Tax=Sporosarcina sp. FSL W7-1283 TaxID=2921560 RepID=UPI0030F87D0F
MSTEKEKTKNVKPEAVKPLTVETLYTREEIKATPSAFGVMPEVLAGALAMVGGDKLSRSQVTEAITAFKNRKV